MHYRGLKVAKKLIATLLAFAMLVNFIPMTALANINVTKDNTLVQNQAILDALKQLYGDDVTAQLAAQELENLGLIDGGELVTATIDIDGEQLTLEQVRLIVNAADADLNKVVSVDGTSITLRELKLMIEIEDELKRIQDTYFSDVTLDEVQQQALASLKEQIADEGIMMSSSTPDLVFPSGIDHGIYVEVVATTPVLDNGSGAQSVAVTLKNSDGTTLTAVPNYDIQISYRFVEGSARLITNFSGTDGMILFSANDDEVSQSITFSIANDERHRHRWEGQKTFLLQYYSPQNVVFEGGKVATETVVKIKKDNVWRMPPKTLVEWSGTWDRYTYMGTMRWSRAVWSSHVSAPFPPMDEEGVWLNVINEYVFPDQMRLSLDISSANVVDMKAIQPGVYVGDMTSEWLSYNPYPQFNLPQNTVYKYSEVYPVSGLLAVSLFEGRPIQIGNELGSLFNTDGNFTVALKLTLEDTLVPSVQNVTVPTDVTFEYGQTVPITVWYSEPVNLANAKLTVNTTTLSPVESASTGTRLATFLYPISKLDDNTLIVTNVTGSKDLWGNAQTSYSLGNKTFAKVIKGVNKANAFGATTALVDAKMRGTVAISLSDPLPEWVATEAAANYDESLRKYRLPSIFASTDGGVTKIDLYVDNAETPTALVGNFTPVLNLSGSDENRVMELYLDLDLNSPPNHHLLIGTYDVYTVPPVFFLSDSDLTITEVGFPLDRTFFAEDGDVLIGYEVSNEDATWQSADDFTWTSSNPSVATISSKGVIAPTGTPGEVTFKLTALNGGITDKVAFINSAPITFRVGLTPFLKIPDGVNVIMLRQGSNAEVRWISNLIAKNAEEDSPTEFAIKVYRTDCKTGSPQPGDMIFSQSVTASLAYPLSNYSIPASVLADVSAAGTYGYIVEVSSLDPVSSETLKATAYITVLSRPAIVGLGQLPSYFITDATTKVPLNWTLQYFDVMNDASFELEIRNNTDGSLVGKHAATTSLGGSYELTVPPVASGLKDIYTVTVKAKNAADSTWSYDSCVLYVYSDKALKIWIDGATVGNQFTMSNIAKIRAMTSAEILDMQRDINLKTSLALTLGTTLGVRLATR